jgi:hypothetical protein
MANIKLLTSVLSRLLARCSPTTLLSVIFLFSVSTIHAEDVSIGPEPEWLYKPVLKPVKPYAEGSVSDGYYLEYVDGQVNLRSQAVYRHVIRHIVNESGVQNASEVSVTYDPAYQKVIFHKIVLIRNGRKTSQLNLDQIKVVQEETEAESFLYYGMKRAFIILKGTRKDDRIEYAYSIVGFNPVFENRFTDKIYFSADEEISNYFQTYLVPDDRSLTFKTLNGASQPVKTKRGDLDIYHWNNPPLKLYESQNKVPEWFDNYPSVEISEFRNWKEVADWGYNLFSRYKYEIPDDLKSKISKWRTISKGDNEMFANLATRFVQDEIRYLGMEIGMYSHKPHLPSEVFKQAYGDCKDKALLLTTILRQEGIPAYVALVSTTRRSQLQFATPSIEDFDHAIVAVERSSGFLFMDATVNFQRGEFSTTYIPDYGFALLLKDGQDKLQSIEPGYPNSTEIIERYVLPLKDSSRLIVTTLYQGGAADKIRAEMAEVSMKEMSLSYLKFYEKYLDGIKYVKFMEAKDDSVRNHYHTLEEYVMPSFWENKKNGGKVIEVYAKSVDASIPDPKGAYTEGPMAIEFPLMLKYSLILDLDEQYSLPFEDIHQKTDSYQFDFTSSVNGNQVELKYFYKTFKDHIPQNELAAYKEAYTKIAEYMSFEFSKGDGTQSPKEKARKGDSGINWLMVLIAVLLLGGVVAAFRKLDDRAPKNNVSFANESIGGWVAFLGVTLLLSLLFQLYSFSQSNYFDHSTWIEIENSGGKFLQFIFVVELINAAFTISFLSFLLYWFIKRRDIFPEMFIGYFIGFLSGQLLLIILYIIAHSRNILVEVPKENTIAFVRSLIYGAVWTTYVRRSLRVKNTFVVRKHS